MEDGVLCDQGVGISLARNVMAKELSRSARWLGVLPAACATFWILGLGAISTTKALNLMESGLWRTLMSAVMLNAAVIIGMAIAPSQKVTVSLLLALAFTSVSVNSVGGGGLTLAIGMAYNFPAILLAGIWGWRSRKNENNSIGEQLHSGG